MSVSLPWTIDNHTRLHVRAFITRFQSALGSVPPQPRTAAWLSEPGSRCELQPPDDTVRSVVRDALREQGFKPTGRSKPSSEYLLRASADASLRAINPAVDAGNAISLRSGLPISVIDLALVSQPLAIRHAEPGASYVFNPTGQTIALAGLPCLFDALGPCANAIKDAQRTKTSDHTEATLSIVWSAPSLRTRTDDALQLYKDLLTTIATLEPVEMRDRV